MIISKEAQEWFDRAESTPVDKLDYNQWLHMRAISGISDNTSSLSQAIWYHQQAKIDHLTEINKLACEDWAGTDTFIKNQCVTYLGKKFIDGDSYYVPCMEDCVQKTIEHLEELISFKVKHVQQLEKEVEDLTKANEILDSERAEANNEAEEWRIRYNELDSEIVIYREALKSILDLIINRGTSCACNIGIPTIIRTALDKKPIDWLK